LAGSVAAPTSVPPMLLPDPPCPLCGRPITPEARPTRHHLTPKLKGGSRGPAVLLHRICHNAIHARFSEAELARRLNDLPALRAEPDIARFLAWVADKPPDFHAPTRRARAKRGPSRGRMS
jgi:5-methylcytosine-specific restriction protein A